MCLDPAELLLEMVIITNFFFSIPYVTILICYTKLYIVSSNLFCLDKRVLL